MHLDLSSTPTRRSRRRIALALAAAAAAAGPALIATAPAGAASPVLPPPGSCHLVDFRTATVDPLVSSDPLHADRVLTVTGLLAEPGKVSLQPLVYIRQPEHWGIEVVACTSAASPGPVRIPPDRTLPVPPFRIFTTSLSFTGTFGTCGVEVIGATRSEKIDLGGPGCEAFGPAA
jgi:hypothetical protein